MQKLIFWFTIFISGALCFGARLTLGQPFPNKPTARLSKGTIERIAYSPDGKLLAVAGSLGIWLYDTGNLNEVGLLGGYAGKVDSVAFSPDGKTLASGKGRTVCLWDVPRRKQVSSLYGHKSTVCSVAFSPDGKTLASGSWDETIRLWDVGGQKQVGLLQEHTREVYSIAFGPDKKTLASGSGQTVRLWDVGEQKGVATLLGHTDQVYSLAFSNNGKWLASGSRDGTILLWELNLLNPLKGKQLITWGILKRTALYQNHPNPFNPETWIPYYLAEDTKVTIRIYDVRGQLVRKLELGQKPAGAYFTKGTAAYWDGRNARGEAVASGVYFYCLSAGEVTATRRMFVVK